ncbi:Protein of unknown function [Bacillus mycoides]|nr:Protein of unknown function [Bacillus mycoides]
MLLFEDLVFVAALNSPFSVFTSDLYYYQNQYPSILFV